MTDSNLLHEVKLSDDRDSGFEFTASLDSDTEWLI